MGRVDHEKTRYYMAVSQLNIRKKRIGCINVEIVRKGRAIIIIKEEEYGFLM